METIEQKLIKNLTWLERYDNQTQKEIITKLNLAQEQILDLIASTTNKRTIQTELNKIFNDAFSTFETVLNDDVAQIQEVAWNSVGAIMTGYIANSTFKNWVDLKKETREKLLNKNTTIQGFTLDEHLSHLKTSNVRKIRGIITNGFDSGSGIDEINREVKKSIANINRNQSKTLIRTILLENIEKTKESLYTDTFGVEEFKYSSVLDGRTSSYCLIANGYVTTNKKTAKYKPKSHYNCRSMWIPQNDLIKEADAKATMNLSQETARKVNHRDGTTSTKWKTDSVKQIPRNTKGIEALKYYDDKYLKSYLGKTRYDLYKSGRAEFKDMFDISRGKMLNIGTLLNRIKD